QFSILNMEFNRETYNKGRRFSFWQVLLNCHEAILTNRPLSHKRRRAWQSVTRMSVLVPGRHVR
ncbi:MAG: hypothetical protein WA730_21140, partial [Pseudolabrys sp.]